MKEHMVRELLKGKKNDYLLLNHLGNGLTRRGIADILDNAENWPSKNSLIIYDDIIIIVFDKNEIEYTKRNIDF